MRCSTRRHLAARLLACAWAAWALAAHAQEAPTLDDARAALREAVRFYHDRLAVGGGYVYCYSGDLTLSEGEAKTTGTAMIWVQPPGTPTVGSAYLDAYEATGDPFCLTAAREAAYALVSGQLRTGGWYYHIELDPVKRLDYLYRDLPVRKVPRAHRTTAADDNTTGAAVRFLMRYDKALGFSDQRVHEAVLFTLEALLAAQYPIGAWGHNWTEYPRPVSADEYPVIRASYPETWPHQWPNDWTGRYFLNDRIVMDLIAAMLDAHDTYGDARYLASALRAGGFLLLAQMPDPQPAWAQQYDPAMHPVWDRKFEPPAITGLESQDVLRSLLLLYRRTADREYLEPLPRALEYLRRSRLPDGRLARFYELRTNRPLYFTEDYQLTYDPAACPKHYSFVVASHLDEIEAEYARVAAMDPAGLWPPEPLPAPEPDDVRRVIESLDERGAWVEEGVLHAHDVKPASGVIRSQTFADNVALLCRFIAPRD